MKSVFPTECTFRFYDISLLHHAIINFQVYFSNSFVVFSGLKIKYLYYWPCFKKAPV